ncbi:MAG: hydrogen gas-evolving membrane-bound hydrogenase subunit E [Candidatus Omnitrophota bacterium]|jgi:multisubunit Na+/H+ antiporter MnhB subunit
MIEINLLLIFIIIGALVAINVKDLLSAVVAVGVSGLGLCITFLTLKAPDLAITQLVVEILCLAILIRVTTREDLPFSTSGRWFFNTLATLVFLAVFLYMGFQALNNLPVFGDPAMRVSEFYLNEAREKTHAANLVSAINLNFRAYDTLGEATVLFAAAIGVMTVMRKKSRKKLEERDKSEG